MRSEYFLDQERIFEMRLERSRLKEVGTEHIHAKIIYSGDTKELWSKFREATKQFSR